MSWSEVNLENAPRDYRGRFTKEPRLELTVGGAVLRAVALLAIVALFVGLVSLAVTSPGPQQKAIVKVTM
tara:strand:+ start:403 stop:612 length:210 start_codon:yes stop_codon:yes gene_type:complete